MTRVVHHYFPHGSSNVGDTLVAHAIQQALRRYWGPLEFVNIAVNDRFKETVEPTGLHGRNIDRSNAEADLVVVGGSNLLEPRKPPKKNSSLSQWHWGVQTDGESLKRLKTPVMLIGMGTGSDWGQSIRPYTSKASNEVRQLFQLSFASAVRDEMTKEKLEEIGVTTQCTGCPVTFLTDRPVEKQTGEKPLLVSLPPARILKTWSGRWFMHQTMSYLRWLHQNDISIIATLHERADKEFAPHWLPRGTKTFYTEDVGELIERYEESRGVIGFRLHAALLSLGLGKPIVPANVDWRGRGFSQAFGLDDIALEPGKWGHFRRLRNLTRQLLDGNDTLVARLNYQKQHFLRKYQQFHQEAARWGALRETVRHAA